jgi:CRP-like cAMP-binding protein
LPLTQENIADVAGLTVVHVNRVLQDLRVAGIISFQQRILTVHDWARLCARAEFDPAYRR